MKLAYLREKGTHSVQLKGLVVDQRETERWEKKDRGAESFERERERPVGGEISPGRRSISMFLAHIRRRERGSSGFRKTEEKIKGKEFIYPPLKNGGFPCSRGRGRM